MDPTGANEYATPQAAEARAPSSALDDTLDLAAATLAWAGDTGRLALAEARLSLSAAARALAWRALSLLLVALAVALALIAAAIALAQWLDSWALALATIAVTLGAAAVPAAWRGQRWRRDIGFVETRRALAPADPP